MNKSKRSPKAKEMSDQLIKQSTGEIVSLVDRLKNLMNCNGTEVFNMTNDIEDLIKKWTDEKY